MELEDWNPKNYTFRQTALHLFSYELLSTNVDLIGSGNLEWTSLDKKQKNKKTLDKMGLL